MTIPELQALAEHMMQSSIKTLQETGSVNQMFNIVYRDHSEVIVAASEVTNSESSKEALGKAIREKIKEGGVEAVLMVSDVWYAAATREQTIVRSIMRMTVKEAADAGLFEAHEAVMVVLESPIMAQMMRQDYRRVPDGSKNIELIGEMVTQDGNVKSGRFTGYWSEARKA